MAGGQGTTTINFGSKATDVATSVSVPAITAGQLVEAWIIPAATATNTVDNHWFDTISVRAGQAVNGVGFTVYATVAQGFAHGSFSIGYVYN